MLPYTFAPVEGDNIFGNPKPIGIHPIQKSFCLENKNHNIHILSVWKTRTIIFIF
jgi:hypothetical protein